MHCFGHELRVVVQAREQDLKDPTQTPQALQALVQLLREQIAGLKQENEGLKEQVRTLQEKTEKEQEDLKCLQEAWVEKLKAESCQQ